MWVLAAVAAASAPLAARASTGDAAFVAGSYQISPPQSGNTVNVQVACIQNTILNTTTGALGFELWYSSAPYSGGRVRAQD